MRKYSFNTICWALNLEDLYFNLKSYSKMLYSYHYMLQQWQIQRRTLACMCYGHGWAAILDNQSSTALLQYSEPLDSWLLRYHRCFWTHQRDIAQFIACFGAVIIIYCRPPPVNPAEVDHRLCPGHIKLFSMDLFFFFIHSHFQALQYYCGWLSISWLSHFVACCSIWADTETSAA